MLIWPSIPIPLVVRLLWSSMGIINIPHIPPKTQTFAWIWFDINEPEHKMNLSTKIDFYLKWNLLKQDCNFTKVVAIFNITFIWKLRRCQSENRTSSVRRKDPGNVLLRCYTKLAASVCLGYDHLASIDFVRERILRGLDQTYAFLTLFYSLCHAREYYNHHKTVGI